MMQLIALIVLAGLVVLSGSHLSFAQGAGGGNNGDARRVLVFTMTKGFRHDAIPTSHEVFQKLASESGQFEVVTSEDVAMFDRETLFGFDAVVFCLTSGNIPLSDEQKQALTDFVSGGRGLVGVHSATDTLYEWPTWGEMIGAYFDGHPWNAGDTVTIKVERPEHPIAAPFGSGSFELTEETYQHKDPYDRDKLTVLLSLDTDRTDMTKRGIKRTDGDFALAWIKPHGDGRVFYTALGHNKAVWNDPRFQVHLLAGLMWTMGESEE